MPRSLPVGTLAKYTTLRQLQVFEAVARLGSFTRAADELYLAQPTVSMQIKKLTNSIGYPLLEQIGQRIEMTEIGRDVYTACHDVFGALESLEMKIAAIQGMRKGHLKLAVLTSAKYLGPHLLGAFLRHYPEIDIELKVTNRENLLKRIERHDDDIYIMGQPPEGLEAESFPLVPNPLVAMARYDHPLAQETHIPLKRLIQEPLIMREQGSGTRAAFEQLITAKGMTLPPPKMEFASNEAIKQAIVAGLGISFMSRHSLVLEGTDGPISILDVQGFPIERNWYLLYPKGRNPSIVTQTFLDFVANEGRDLLENFEAEMKDFQQRRRKPITKKTVKSTQKKKA